jgi:hypothetical protein
MKPLSTAAAVLALCLAPAAQTAAYTIVGSGCSTGRITPFLGPVPFTVQGLPRLGSTFTIATEGSTSYPWGTRRIVVLITGLSNTSAGGAPLPFDISTLFPGQPVCGLLRTSPEIVTRVASVAHFQDPVHISFAVPNDPALAGARFYQQALSRESSTFGPPFGAISLSAGGEATIGF